MKNKIKKFINWKEVVLAIIVSAMACLIFVFFYYKPIPKCDTQETISVVKSVVTNAYAERFKKMNLQGTLNVDNMIFVKEDGFDEEENKRVCSGILGAYITGSDESEFDMLPLKYRVEYSISNDKRNSKGPIILVRTFPINN